MVEAEKFDAVEGEHVPFYESSASDGDGGELDDSKYKIEEDPAIERRRQRTKLEKDMDDFVAQPDKDGRFPGPKGNIRKMIRARSIRTFGINTDADNRPSKDALGEGHISTWKEPEKAHKILIRTTHDLEMTKISAALKGSDASMISEQSRRYLERTIHADSEEAERQKSVMMTEEEKMRNRIDKGIANKKEAFDYFDLEKEPEQFEVQCKKVDIRSKFGNPVNPIRLINKKDIAHIIDNKRQQILNFQEKLRENKRAQRLDMAMLKKREQLEAKAAALAEKERMQKNQAEDERWSSDSDWREEPAERKKGP